VATGADCCGLVCTAAASLGGCSPLPRAKGAVMARPHIESIHAYDVEAEEVDDGPFAGTRRRPLSTDDADGSSTALVTFPAGWRGDLAGPQPVELLVLTGEGPLGGRPLRAGARAWVPAGTRGVLAFGP